MLRYLLLLLLTISSFELRAETYLTQQTLSSTISGTPVLGDGYGQTIKLYDKWMFVAAPYSSTDGKSNAGAIYVYRRKDSNWTNTQVITTGGTSDLLGAFQIEMQGRFLFVSAIGTPTGPIPNDIPAEQDFTGAVLIYRYDDMEKVWKFSQSIDRTTNGLAELTPINTATASNPPLVASEIQQGASFGLNFSVDLKNKILLVGAPYQQGQDSSGNAVVNAGAAYAFRLNENRQWGFVQKITNPDGIVANDTFGANVCIKGRFALISNAQLLQPTRTGNNSAVYVYHLSSGQWNHLQKLTGDQSTPATINSPSLGNIAVGDAFGSSLALDDRWAIIGAALECRTPGGPLSGAAYFYRLAKVDGIKQLTRTQKIFSDDPNAQGTSFIHVALQGETALISDPTRTGPAGPAQGGVLVYRLKDNLWQHTHTLYDPNGQPFGFFGVGVSKFDKYYAGGDGPTIAGQFFSTIGNPVIAVPALNPAEVVIFQRQYIKDEEPVVISPVVVPTTPLPVVIEVAPPTIEVTIPPESETATQPIETTLPAEINPQAEIETLPVEAAAQIDVIEAPTETARQIDLAPVEIINSDTPIVFEEITVTL